MPFQFYLALLIVVGVLFTAMYLTRLDKEKPWYRHLRDLFRLKTHSH